MSARVEELLAGLALDEKADLVAGVDLWHTPGAPRLGIPALKVTDGPSGARGEQWSGRPSANFPCASLRKAGMARSSPSSPSARAALTRASHDLLSVIRTSCWRPRRSPLFAALA